MSKLTVMFPETDVVSVVFAFKKSTNKSSYDFDDAGVIPEHQKKMLKEYYYRVPSELVGKLAAGDMVVVNCANGFQVAEVKCINTYSPSGDKKSLAYVVGKVDCGAYFKCLADKKQLAMLRNQLEEEKKRIESMVTCELLAERSPEFKALLDNFKALGGSLE